VRKDGTQGGDQVSVSHGHRHLQHAQNIHLISIKKNEYRKLESGPSMAIY
jgi:hypothetical protein